MAGVVRSIVLLRSSEILRSIRESVAPRGVASIDPPGCLARSTATPSLSLPLAPLPSRSPSFLPSLRVHTPPTPFPSRVFLFRFEASIPFPRLNRLFVSVSIDTPVSFPSIYAPAFLLSFPRSLHISPLLSSSLPEASCFLVRVTLSLSVFSFLTSVSFFLSLSLFSTPRSMPRSPAAPCFRSYRRGSCSSSSFLLLLPPPRSRSPSLVRVLFPFSFLRFFRPGSTTDDVRLLCDGVADANPRRPLERRSIAEADAFLSSNHAESAGFGQVSRFFPSVRPGENPTK